MKLTYKFKPKLSHKEKQIIEELSWHTSKFYNIVNYQIRENGDLKPVYSKLDKQFKGNWHCNFLMAHNRQHCLKILAQDWKSYFNSLKDYKENPSKYKGQPQPPNFKHMDSNPNQIIFTNEVAVIKNNKLVLSLQKLIRNKYKVENLNFELPKIFQNLIFSENAPTPKGHTKANTLKQVKIKRDYHSKEWIFLIVYETQEKEQAQNTNIMAIDLGLNNLASLTFKDNSESYIINGKPLKSKNRYYNNKITKLQSIRMKQTGSKHFKDTKQIKTLRIKRKNYVNNYLHQASRKIINLAKKHNVVQIVIGDLKDIKQNNKNNRNFVAIPIQRLKKQINYKAKLEGIKVSIINEAFTSGCSGLDKEQLNKDDYDKTRRISRGLFISNTGIKINSDVNGSLNILRKYLKNSSPKLIQQARDKGFVNNPVRLRVS